MAKITLKLTDKHIELIRNLKFKSLEEIDRRTSKKYGLNFEENFFGFDKYDLYGGTYLYEQMALILGYQEQMIEGTMEDVDGPKYPQEIMDLFVELDTFIVDNLVNIEEILHQYCTVGIKPGTYVCKDYQRLWSYIPDKE